MDKVLLRDGFILLTAATAFFTLILGLILAYHWEKFAMNHLISRFAILVYIAVTLSFIGALVALLPA